MIIRLIDKEQPIVEPFLYLISLIVNLEAQKSYGI